jgi:hypothetical protein
MLSGVQTDIAGPVFQCFVANAPRKAMLTPKLLSEPSQEIFDDPFHSKEPTCNMKTFTSLLQEKTYRACVNLPLAPIRWEEAL